MLNVKVFVRLLDEIFAADSVDSILAKMFESGRAIGGDKISYHPELMFDGASPTRPDVFYAGYPADWAEIYTNAGEDFVDPIPDLVMRAGKAMTWKEAVSSIKLTKNQLAYIKAAREHGVRAGMGFPLWGPSGQDAYVAIGFPGDEVNVPPDVLRTEHLVLLAGHQRIVELAAPDVTVPVLSTRERDVLQWVAKGKSNTDIATIIDISPETVATYMRRIYAKLGCHDRVGAVIKALRSRLIHL
jgi:DNA-binding CsgD family transcriptional regulator